MAAGTADDLLQHLLLLLQQKASSSVDVFTLSVCKRGSIHSINRNGLKRAVTTSPGYSRATAWRFPRWYPADETAHR